MEGEKIPLEVGIPIQSRVNKALEPEFEWL
jgi:hypothetical protein